MDPSKELRVNPRKKVRKERIFIFLCHRPKAYFVSTPIFSYAYFLIQIEKQVGKSDQMSTFVPWFGVFGWVPALWVPGFGKKEVF